MTGDLRPELPELPPQIAALPRHRGYPVPYFVTWVADTDPPQPLPRGEGTPDFRVILPQVVEECWDQDRCWVCGRLLHSRFRSFVIGPMCAINRTSAEPPSHNECAEWSAIACPFLSRPHARRRPTNYEGAEDKTPGIMLDRNPGVALVWRTRNPSRFSDGRGGKLFEIGDPVQVDWYAEGRKATREEVMASIDSGMPVLQEMADEEGEEAQEELAYRRRVVEERLMPA